MLSSSVVTNPRVPRVVRHSLKLESGMNDGLALPAVLAFATALSPSEKDFLVALRRAGRPLGLAFGIAGGFLASRLLPRGRGLSDIIPAHQQSLYALGVAFAIYGIAVALPPAGNDFIAVFVGAITLSILRRDVAANFEHRAEDLVDRQARDLRRIRLAADAREPVRRRLGRRRHRRLHAAARPADRDLDGARPAAASIRSPRGSLRCSVRRAWQLDVALFVLGEGIPSGQRMFDVAAPTAFSSILLHGLTDTPATEWLARRTETASRRHTPATSVG